MFLDLGQPGEGARNPWVARERRESTWRDAVCNTFVRLDCRPDRHAAFHGRLTAGVVGDLHVSRVEGAPQLVERTTSLIAQADQAYVLMSIQLRGRTVVEQADSQAVLTPGCVAFYDSERPYTLRLPNDFDQIVLHLPRTALERSVPAGFDHMAQKIPASNPYAQAIAALAPQLLNLAMESPSELAQRTADAAVELIRLALASLDTGAKARLAAPSQLVAASGIPTGQGQQALLARARELMAVQLNDDKLNPQALAEQLHVSLRRLQEVFQQHGSTLSDSLWEMRLDFARARLASDNHRHESVSEVAFASGFSDTAHFSRRFKQRFGETPREFRAGSAH